MTSMVSNRRPATDSGSSRGTAKVGMYILTALVVCIGLLFVFLVRPGTPSDEPSHFATVMQYADHWGRLPILGHPGVSYEAQNGPVYYLLAAALLVPLRAVLGLHGAFYALRALLLSLGIVEVWLAWAVVRRMAPRAPWMALASAGVIGLDPQMLSIEASIQNDALTIALVLLVTYLTVRWVEDRPASMSQPALLGALTGLAVLTKITALFLVATIPCYLLYLAAKRRFRWSQALRQSSVFGTGCVAVAGWWFVRNLHQYHDLTGGRALHAMGLSFPATDVSSLRAVARLAYNVVTYYWVPTEYYRNLFHAPVLVKAVVAVALAAACLGLVLHGKQLLSKSKADILMFVVLSYVLSLLGWAVYTTTVMGLAPRTSFGGYLLYAVLIGVGLVALVGIRARRAEPAVGAFCLAAIPLLALDGWVLVEVAMLGRYPFTLF